MSARITIMIHYFPPHLGGMEEVSAQQAASLAGKGHEVKVLTQAHGRGLSRSEHTPAGYTVVRRPALNVVERRFGVTFPVPSPQFVITAWRQVRAADLVHVHDVFYLSSHIVSSMARFQRKPMFLTQHVALVEHPSRLVMGVQHLIYRTVGRRMVHQARGIVAYNTNVRDHLLEMGADATKVLLTHNGIDTDYYAPANVEEKDRLRREYGVPLEKPVVLFIGRLVHKKGFDLVFGARSPDHTTIIAGNGAVPGHMRGGADVVWFGPADRRQVRDLYRLSDVFVFPTTGEMFTLVMQEAMAVGLPVITTDDPGYRGYDFDRTAVSLVEREQSAVAAEVQRLLADPDRRAEMGERARAVALDRFSWRANYDAEYAVYRTAPPVVYVTATYPPALGGTERVAASLAAAVGARRPVTVLTSRVGSGAAPSEPGVRVRRFRAAVLAKVPVMPGLLVALLRLPSDAIVHVHVAQAFTPEAVWLTSRVRRRPYVAHFHLDIEPSGVFGPIFVRYKRLVLRRVLRGAHRVVALNAEQAAFLAAHHGVEASRVVVIPNGVDRAFIGDGPATERHGGPLRLLFVGRLSPQKNVGRLLRAMARVTSAVELVIVGDGEQRASLEGLLAELNLPNVRMVGGVHGDALIDWYRWADAFVLPSDKEGMPLVILEAMAAGLPVIATDVTGLRETVGDDGLLVAPDDGALAAGIDRLAGDEELRGDLAVRSYRRGGDHRWEHLAATYDRLYAEVAAPA